MTKKTRKKKEPDYDLIVSDILIRYDEYMQAITVDEWLEKTEREIASSAKDYGNAAKALKIKRSKLHRILE